MKALAETLLNEMVTDDHSLESALVSCGWKRLDDTCWQLGKRNRDALLVEVSHRDQWRQFQLSGGATPQTSNKRVMHDNSRFSGPAKFVARLGGDPVCRLDVPDNLAGSVGASYGIFDDLCVQNANLTWAQAVTAVASRRIPLQKAPQASDVAIAAELTKAGWSVSLDDEQLVIHLQLPGVYRQLTLERHERIGATLAVDLIELTDLTDGCLSAMLLLAQETNRRLPLARMAIVESSKRIVLRAEVSFGVAMVGGSLLLHSLQVLEMAVRITARELEALRDAELARLVLSAAANNFASRDMKGD